MILACSGLPHRPTRPTAEPHFLTAIPGAALYGLFHNSSLGLPTKFCDFSGSPNMIRLIAQQGAASFQYAQ